MYNNSSYKLTTNCYYCNQKVEKRYIKDHLLQCDNSPQPLPQSSQQRNSQLRDNRIQKQQSQKNQKSTPTPNLQRRPQSENTMEYQRCEYCDQNYPDIIFDGHVKLCTARLQLVEIQNEETLNQANQQEHNQDSSQSLRRGQRYVQQLLSPDGRSVMQRIVSKDQNGNVSVQETITRSNNRDQQNQISNSSQQNQVQSRNQQNQVQSRNQQNQFQSQNSQRQPQFIIVSRNNNDSRNLGNIEQFIQFIFSALQHNETGQGLQDEELDSMNRVIYKKSKTLSDENNKCIICITEYQENEELKLLPCTHRFHNTCIRNWLKDHPECPICRKSVRE